MKKFLCLLSLLLSSLAYGASGDTLLVFTPAMGEPPGSNFATFSTRNVVLVLNYDADTDESSEFPGFMPAHYGGGGIDVVVGWMAETATSGTISLDVGFKSISDDLDDLDSKAFATVRNANPTAATATGEVDYVTISFTDGSQMDSIAAGEYFRMIVTRDANGTTSTDNMTDDMQLVFVSITEQ